MSGNRLAETVSDKCAVAITKVNLPIGADVNHSVRGVEEGKGELDGYGIRCVILTQQLRIAG